MEQALMAVCKDIRLGKILIQTNHDTGEPEVPRPEKQHLINSIKKFCGKNLEIHL